MFSDLDVDRKTTGDGSPTLVRRETGWSYRSMAGAHLESDHIFVQGTGLPERTGPWRVLEFGLGAGTNLARTVAAAAVAGTQLEYEAVESELLEPTLLPEHGGGADELLRAAAVGGAATEGARLLIHHGVFTDFAFEPTFHAVFFDPFGPDVQPGSWSVDAFRIAVGALVDDGVLATYSAAGWVRRNLAAAGAFVATVPGPPSKREFTIAARSRAVLGDATVRNVPAPHGP